MSDWTVRVLPKVERSGAVTILTFAPHREADGFLARDLAELPAGAVERHVLLDFTNVAYLNSTDLSTLITSHKRAEATGGRLTLFNLSNSVFQLFTITRLNTLLEICRPATIGDPVSARSAEKRL
jgi:anti-anti-sigma factor